jgi:hypothetical protein
MVENQHREISGYRDLTRDEIDLMNEAKALEAQAAQQVARTRESLIKLGRMSPQAARDLSMARTAYEDATIRLVRAVAQPVTPWE